MRAVTPKQLGVLRYIAHYLDSEGFPPSIREICDVLGVASTNGASDHIKRLRQHGLLAPRDPDRQRARSLVITKAGREALE